jgi:hypothetical protein
VRERQGHAAEAVLELKCRLVRMIATCCILSWRIFWMTMINRTSPQTSPTIALTPLEVDLLDELFSDPKRDAGADPCLRNYIICIARLVATSLGHATPHPAI